MAKVKAKAVGAGVSPAAMAARHIEVACWHAVALSSWAPVGSVAETEAETLSTKSVSLLKLFYSLLITIAGLLVVFSVVQLAALLRGANHLLSFPAAVVLAIASLALLFEFYVGLRVDLR